MRHAVIVQHRHVISDGGVVGRSVAPAFDQAAVTLEDVGVSVYARKTRSKLRMAGIAAFSVRLAS